MDAPDLRGHGASGEARPATIAACIEDLRTPEPLTLAGYSMGGRLALHLALAQPDAVRRLVLVSTTAGLADPDARAARRAADGELADGLEQAGLETFARWWAAQPLFDGQSVEVRAFAAADRARSTAAGLAASLRGMGTGAMEPVWDRLGELTMPVAVLAGERDAKFRAIAERLAEALPDATLTVVPDAGHAVHLEQPAAVAEALSTTDRLV